MRISAIIPSFDTTREENLNYLVDDLRRQSLPPDEIEIVRGVSPHGHARNIGVERTTGDILISLDDDVRLGTTNIIESFVQYLTTDSKLGMIGTTTLLPPDSTPFQRRCARQISRSEAPVLDTLTDSDMVTDQCCAMRRKVLVDVGGFHDSSIRGVDPELRHRMRQAGYRVAVIPNAWHYHPMPASLRALLRMAWRNGAASAYSRRHFPETVLYNPEGHVGEFNAKVPFPRRVILNLGHLAFDLLTGRWYGFLYGMAYAMGNVMERD